MCFNRFITTREKLGNVVCPTEERVARNALQCLMVRCAKIKFQNDEKASLSNVNVSFSCTLCSLHPRVHLQYYSQNITVVGRH